MITTKNEAPEREEIETLLPWFAAGTLNRRDAARVETALAHDAELSRRFEMVREELGETIRLNESLGAPSARAMTRLFEKIDAEPAARRSPVSLNLGARISEFIAGFAPRTLAYAGAVAVLAIVLQAGVITGLLSERTGDASYRTVSLEPAQKAGEGAVAVIRFNPQASASDITKFLESNKVTIIDGPATGGMYRVRIPAKSKDEAAAVLKKLAENKVVEFAAPVQ